MFVVVSSLFASLLLGSMTTMAATTNSGLNITVIPIVNGGLKIAPGGAVTYIYQIWNNSSTPVSNVHITDNKCNSEIFYDGVGEDLNGDHKIDKGELWSFWCTFNPMTTTTNTVTVSGQMDGAPVSASTSTTIVVPPAPAGSNGGINGSGTGVNGTGSSNGSNGTAGSNGSAGVPKGLPNTGFGGASHAKAKAVVKKAVKKVVVQTAVQKATLTITGPAQKTSLPQELKIPSIGVDAKVQAVGVTANGNMEAPANATDVSWYKFGAQPGQSGNAVIAGHLDTYTTSNGVFANLNKVQSGDDVYVVNGQDKTLHFKVTSTQTVSNAQVPLSPIFGEVADAHLNLITCTGAWDPKKHQYTERLVVFTSLVK